MLLVLELHLKIWKLHGVRPSCRLFLPAISCSCKRMMVRLLWHFNPFSQTISCYVKMLLMSRGVVRVDRERTCLSLHTFFWLRETAILAKLEILIDRVKIYMNYLHWSPFLNLFVGLNLIE